jgi:hypothetical protein
LLRKGGMSPYCIRAAVPHRSRPVGDRFPRMYPKPASSDLRSPHTGTCRSSAITYHESWAMTVLATLRGLLASPDCDAIPAIGERFNLLDRTQYSEAF